MYPGVPRLFWDWRKVRMSQGVRIVEKLCIGDEWKTRRLVEHDRVRENWMSAMKAERRDIVQKPRVWLRGKRTHIIGIFFFYTKLRFLYGRRFVCFFFIWTSMGCGEKAKTNRREYVLYISMKTDILLHAIRSYFFVFFAYIATNVKRVKKKTRTKHYLHITRWRSY